MAGDARRLWQESRRQARLCRRLLDPAEDGRPADAATAFLRGWFLAAEAIAASEGRAGPTDDRRTEYLERKLADAVPAADPPALGRSIRAVAGLHRDLAGWPGSGEATCTRMLEHLGWLDALLTAVESRVVGIAPWYRRPAVWLAGAVAAVSLLVAMAWLLLGGGGGAWSVAYHPSPDFGGPAVQDRLGALDLHWGHGRSPFGSGPFSAEARTCLGLDGPTEMRFELGSAGGARLWVDDTLLIDDRDVHEHRVRLAVVALPPGTHTLRVEFLNTDGAPSLELRLAEQGSALDHHGGGRLSYPRHGTCGDG